MIAAVGAPPVVIVLAALAFAVASGANEGGTLVSLATRTAVLRPGAALIVLSGLVAFGPMLFGTAVATTIAHRLVSFSGGSGRLAVLGAIVASLVIVAVLSRKGLSTSLTLALMGGIAGVGLGAGLHVSWGVIGGVLAVAFVAPLAAGGVAYLLTRAVVRSPASWWVGRFGRVAQRAGYVGQSFAYSVNGAQKMVALVAIGSQVASPVAARLWSQLLIGACYAVGTVLGVRPLAGRIGEQVLRVRPANATVLELSSSAVAIGSSALGAPVSITQAATTSLVGTGLATDSHRVRWWQAGGIGMAWLLTLPASVALGALFGVLVRLAR